MNENTHKKVPVGKLIAIAIVVIVVVAMMNPHWLFFLTPEQQQVIADFQRTYFTNALPISGPEGGFDWLRVGALVILFAECWVVNSVVALVAKKWTLKNRHAETLKGLACNCIKYAVVIFAIIFGLSILGINMVAVLTSLGIVGLVVGFGAQSLIEDVITGLFIIFEGQFHVGDIITIDNFRGTVTAIGIRTTNLMDAGGNIKIINNSDIRTLTNLSEVDSFAIADIGISYNASIPAAEAAIGTMVAEMPILYPGVFKEPPTYSGVQDLAASSVNLRVVAKVDEANVYTARRLLNRELKMTMDKAGIEIPFPQVVVHQSTAN
ncbi:MAG: mechanosensitive ion channel family protein [Oscillospiraceae bacterium]